MTGPDRLSLYLIMIMVLCMNLTGCGDTKPNTPSGLTAVAGNGKVTVSWSGVSSSTYRLYWSATSGGAKTGSRIDRATSPYVLTGLTNGTTYYFAVMAVNSEGESPLSSEVSATPAASSPPATPTNVTATPGPGVGKATISWTAVAGATSYYVYYSTTSANATRANGLRFSPSNTATQEITGLAAGTWYFSVTSVNSNADESTASAPVVSAVIQ